MAATRLVYKNLILYVNAVFFITFLRENLKFPTNLEMNFKIDSGDRVIEI